MTREEAAEWMLFQKEQVIAMSDNKPGTLTVAYDMAIEALQAEPKHGEWEPGLLREFRDTNIEAQEKADKAGYVRYVVNLKCSACRKITMVDNSVKYNFCPNCGAKMDKR